MIGKIFLASPEHISLFILWLLPWEEWNKVAYINFDYHYGIKRIEVLCKIYGFVLPGMQSLAFLSNANSKLHNWLKDLRKIHWNFKGKPRLRCNLADLSSRQKKTQPFLCVIFHFFSSYLLTRFHIFEENWEYGRRP